MGKRQKRNHRGFTLIELVIVITILAILAAVAIPAFQNLTGQARNAGVQGALGGLRSALAVYRANQISTGCDPASGAGGGAFDCWPSSTAVLATAMENGTIPDNPWCRTSAGCSPSANLIVSVTGVAGTARPVTNTTGGWNYQVGDGIANNGLIYANTSLNGGTTTENTY